MKIITVSALKGGVGKTMTIYNLAGMLAKEKKRVLIIDADSQGNISENFGISQDNEFDVQYETISDIFLHNAAPGKVIMKGIGDNPFIDLIPATIELTITENLISNRPGRERYLSNWIKNNTEVIGKYDFILCDVGPNVGVITQNCLFASDEIFLVTDVSMNGFRGCKLVMKNWQDGCNVLGINNNIKGIIINKFDKRTTLSAAFLSFLQNEELFQNKIFDTVIPDNTQLRRSEIEGTPIAFYDVKSPGYIAYRNLVKELRKGGFL